MPFLLPNQQRQSTEDNYPVTHSIPTTATATMLFSTLCLQAYFLTSKLVTLSELLQGSDTVGLAAGRASGL